jgi:hypothetical protein
MKKILLGWLTHQVVSFAGFIGLCVIVGVCYGMYCAAYGITPMDDKAFKESHIFKWFCFFALLSSSFGGYWLSVRKVLKYED